MRFTLSAGCPASRSVTVALRRLSVSVPFFSSHSISWTVLFGLSMPVIPMASPIRSCRLRSSIYKAPSVSSSSTRTPNAFILTSICQSRSSSSGMGNCSRRRRMLCSATTSCLQYPLNSSHFSGACFGRFHVRFPLFFVGLHGTQKYRISALPAASFCLSCGSPTAFPVASSPAGYPQYRLCAMVHLHCSSGVL